MIRVFISYANGDGAFAQEVARVLQAAGLQTWWGNQNAFFPGENWAELVAAKLRESDAMVVLLSPRSSSSKHLEQEISYALANKNYRWRLVPVLVEPLAAEAIPWILRHLQVISAVGPAFAQGINEVVHRLEQPIAPAKLAIQALDV